ncbi:MAG: alpha-mannosidase, partial [Oscillospiraceae bacterium]|nr:alpha-mannosidase [Oscillospiraceae bacterium]
MVFLYQRVGKLIEELERLIYPESHEIKRYKMIRTDRKHPDIGTLDTAAWDLFDHRQIWGGHREYYLFETVIEIPESFDGRCVVYELATGREGLWDATNPQFTIYIDGVLVQGLDVNHRSVVLAEK